MSLKNTAKSAPQEDRIKLSAVDFVSALQGTPVVDIKGVRQTFLVTSEGHSRGYYTTPCLIKYKTPEQYAKINY